MFEEKRLHLHMKQLLHYKRIYCKSFGSVQKIPKLQVDSENNFALAQLWLNWKIWAFLKAMRTLIDLPITFRQGDFLTNA